MYNAYANLQYSARAQVVDYRACIESLMTRKKFGISERKV